MNNPQTPAGPPPGPATIGVRNDSGETGMLTVVGDDVSLQFPSSANRWSRTQISNVNFGSGTASFLADNNLVNLEVVSGDAETVLGGLGGSAPVNYAPPAPAPPFNAPPVPSQPANVPHAPAQSAGAHTSQQNVPSSAQQTFAPSGSSGLTPSQLVMIVLSLSGLAAVSTLVMLADSVVFSGADWVIGMFCLVAIPVSILALSLVAFTNSSDPALGRYKGIIEHLPNAQLVAIGSAVIGAILHITAFGDWSFWLLAFWVLAAGLIIVCSLTMRQLMLKSGLWG